MKQLTLAGMFSIILLMTACSKTTDEIKVESKLTGKWMLKRWSGNDLIGSQNRPSSGTYEVGEYMQFESGGQFIILVDNKITQSYYKLLDNNTRLYIVPANGIDIPDDGYEIKTLTDHTLVLYWKELRGTTIVSDVTIELAK